MCGWFVDNKLSIHFGEDKTKSFLFSSKPKIEKENPFSIQYEDIKINQYLKATYLFFVFNETLSEESLVTHVVN